MQPFFYGENMLLDISHVNDCCANHALDEFTKALSNETGFDDALWREHENPFIRELVEEFSRRGLLRIAAVQEELKKWLNGEYFKRSANVKQPFKTGYLQRWDDKELGLVQIYLKSLSPENWTLNDSSLLIDWLVQRYMPVDELIKDADWLNAKTAMMGKAQGWLATMAGADAAITVAKIAKLYESMPDTTAEVHNLFNLADAAKQVIDYGELRSADSVVALSDTTRQRLKSVVLDHQSKAINGDPTATQGKLEQDLLYTFGNLNRDWRRIAVTETGEMNNQGFIAAQKKGAMVKRLEQYPDACPFCKKLNGKIYRVTTPDDPNKDGTKDVWVGKTNMGRSISPKKIVNGVLQPREEHEMAWAAAGLQHVNCRGSWQLLDDPEQWDDPVLARLIQKKWSELK